MNLKKELPIMAVALIPIIYLIYTWNQLSSKIPMHWNIEGEIDRYGSKNELLFLTVGLSVFMYVLMLFVPKIDPKNKLKNANKYHSIRLVTSIFITVLLIFIIQATKNADMGNPNYLLMIISAFYLILGNYFKTIKPNYFVGIRLPWTLENEENWKKTHQFGGKIWFIGGFISLILGLFLPQTIYFGVFMGITLLISIIPSVYSYRLSKQIKK